MISRTTGSVCVNDQQDNWQLLMQLVEFAINNAALPLLFPSMQIAASTLDVSLHCSSRAVLWKPGEGRQWLS